MNLHRLRIFRAVVEHQSFSQAAEHLFMTQPSVSLQVRALERQLGVQLLFRQGRRMCPTEAGQVVYEYARGVLTETDELVRTLREVQGARAGQVRVGASTSALYRLVPAVCRFQAQHPGAQLQVHAGAAHEVCQRVLQGELDLGLVVADQVPAGLLVEQTADEDIVLVGAPSHPLFRRSRLSLAVLGQERFVLPPAGTGLRPILDAQLTALGVAHGPIALELNSNEGIKLAVDQGLGLAFFVRCAVAADLAVGRFRALSVPGLRLHATLHLVRRPRRYLSPLMQALLSHLSGELQAPPAS